ncbi:C-type natriuretic protein [Salmonella enterica subsp. enterica]|nr:C-type natriuretic protein [Salmonella enterica subsp. enterica]
MSDMASLDWWLAAYFIAAGIAGAVVIGRHITKMLLVRFASNKRIDDGLWRLGTLLEIRYGELRENETVTIQAKRFTVVISRTPVDQ